MGVDEMQECMARMVLARKGVLPQGAAGDKCVFDIYKDEHDFKKVYRNWREWVESTCPQSAHLFRRRLKGMGGLEQTYCNHVVVREAREALSETLAMYPIVEACGKEP